MDGKRDEGGCKCESAREHEAMEARVAASYLLDRERADLRVANTAWLMRRAAENAEGIAR